MAVDGKVLRQWRIRAGVPFGVHLWFDPRVEHVVLLEGPVLDSSLELHEPLVPVDSDPQQMLPWNGMLSMSGSGKREACVQETVPDIVVLPNGEEIDIPF